MRGTHTYSLYDTADDQTIRPLEYSAHTLWAEATGLAQLIRNASHDELEACRDELIEAAWLILSTLEVKQ